PTHQTLCVRIRWSLRNILSNDTGQESDSGPLTGMPMDCRNSVDLFWLCAETSCRFLGGLEYRNASSDHYAPINPSCLPAWCKTILLSHVAVPAVQESPLPSLCFQPPQ